MTPRSLSLVAATSLNLSSLRLYLDLCRAALGRLPASLHHCKQRQQQLDGESERGREREKSEG